MFGKHYPIPLFAEVFIIFPVVSNGDVNLAHSEDIVRVYIIHCVHTVHPIVVRVLYKQTESSENVLNLRTGQNFPNTLYNKELASSRELPMQNGPWRRSVTDLERKEGRVREKIGLK